MTDQLPSVADFLVAISSVSMQRRHTPALIEPLPVGGYRYLRNIGLPDRVGTGTYVTSDCLIAWVQVLT